MRKSFITLLNFLTLIILLSSCVTTHNTNYLQPHKNFIPAYKDTFTYKEYQLKEGDRLYIQVFSTDDKTSALFNGGALNSGFQSNSGGGNENTDLYTYLVQANGNIDFPIIGQINVIGKTVRQTKELIEESIKPILKINSVDVRMIGKSFSVIGSGKSGHFSFPKDKINIFQALALIGDLGQFTDRSKIRILRLTKNGTQIKSFDLRSVDIINSEFYYIEPDDVIFLQPMNEQFFGVTTFWSTVATIITTGSFVVGVYTLFLPKTVVKP
jgi:polysaccharide biosynthesis/export protein